MKDQTTNEEWKDDFAKKQQETAIDLHTPFLFQAALDPSGVIQIGIIANGSEEANMCLAKGFESLVIEYFMSVTSRILGPDGCPMLIPKYDPDKTPAEIPSRKKRPPRIHGIQGDGKEEGGKK